MFHIWQQQCQIQLCGRICNNNKQFETADCYSVADTERCAAQIAVAGPARPRAPLPVARRTSHWEAPVIYNLSYNVITKLSPTGVNTLIKMPERPINSSLTLYDTIWRSRVRFVNWVYEMFLCALCGVDSWVVGGIWEQKSSKQRLLRITIDFQVISI